MLLTFYLLVIAQKKKYYELLYNLNENELARQKW
jgi:hypothetical protein